MRIALILHQFLPKYSSGTEVLTLQMALHFVRRGYQVAIICGEPSSAQETADQPSFSDEYEGLLIFRVRVNRDDKYPIFDDFESKPSTEIVVKFLETWKPFLVHINHCLGLSTSIIPAIKSLGIPVIYSATDFWLVCPSIQMLRYDKQLCQGPDVKGIECLRCYLSGSSKPWPIRLSRYLPKSVLESVITLASIHLGGERKSYKKVINVLRATPHRQVHMIQNLKAVDSILVATDLMAKIFSKNGLPQEKITKISYGIEPLVLPESRGLKDGFTFGYIGTLSLHKGLDLLIKAFQTLQLTDIRLLIYGDLSHSLSYSRYLKSLAADSPNIQFLGTFPPAEITTVLTCVDVLVVPSRWYENTPLVIHSAFQIGIPVIATNLGGMSEMIIHGHNGLLFSYEDIVDLSAQMKKCLENPTLMDNLRSNIAKKPGKTMNIYIDELEEVYKGLTPSS